jgi:hypothetical protein
MVNIIYVLTVRSKDKKVPMVELKYTDMDGAVDKTKLNVYEDGSEK